MSDRETRVIYKAIADFAAVRREAKKTEAALDSLRAKEKAQNAASVSGSENASKARKKNSESVSDEAKSFETAATSIGRHAAETIKDATAAKQAAGAHRESASAASAGSTATKAATSATQALDGASSRLSNTVKRTAAAAREQAKATESAASAARRGSKDTAALGRGFQQALGNATRFNTGLNKLGNWRPRLLPPFIALVPLIAGVVAGLNPLVALLGAGGVAAFGFASSLGSLAGSAIAVIPALGALLSVVGAIKTAFGGIGGVFKAYGAAQKAKGGGGGGGGGAAAQLEELSRTEKISRAQEDYRRSIEDVRFAEEDLNDAREDAIDRLKELQRAVDRAALSEARASANKRLSQEAYANVMADPGSTKGEKLDAQVSVDEADAELADTIADNRKNQEDLTEAKAKGVEGDRQVIQATRALQDAIDAQRDSQLALANSYKDTSAASGGGGGAAGAADEYAAALARLSPSARAVVLALIGMKDEWDALQKTVQESFFSKIVGNIERLRLLIPPVSGLLSNMAGALGEVANQLILMVTSPEWIRDIGIFSEGATPFVKDVGEGLLFILNGLKDIAIAALPFTQALGKGFREGAENFKNLTASARDDGSLAAYLDKVLGRMQQWWRIVKNVGKTLFNYGAATSDFGNWLTTGFEKVTEGWLESSRKAREEGSPFQKYLEDVQPLLSNVKGLFADFFGWFGREAMKPENIDAMNDIVTTIRDDLGPALTDIMDALTESGAGQGLVDAITSIAEAIATFLDNGGAEGIRTFYDTVTLLFDAFNSFLEVVPEPVVSALATSFAALAALKFFRITNLLNLLLKVAGSAKLATFLSKIPGLGAIAGALGGAGAAGAGGSAAAGAAGAAAGNGSRGTAGGSSVTPPVAYTSRAERKAAEAEAAKEDKKQARLDREQARADKKAGVKPVYETRAERKAAEASRTKTLGKSLNKGVAGGIAVAIAGVAAGNAAQNIRDANVGTPGDAGSGARVGANALEGAGTGAAIGGAIGSVIPVVGTAAGAGVGAAIGAGVGVLSSSQEDIDAFDASVNAALSNLFTVKIPELWNGFVGMVNDWADPINEAVNGWIADGGQGIADFFTVTIPGWYNGFVGGVNEWADPINEKVNTWIADQGKGISDFFSVTIPGWWTDFKGGVNEWGDPINDKVNTWIADKGKGISDFFSVTVPRWWNDFKGGVNAWSDPINSKVNSWVPSGQGIHDFFFVTVPGWFSDFKYNVNNWSNPINDKVNSWLSGASTKVSNWVNNAASSIEKGIPKGRYNGGPILKRAGGGAVPGVRANSDTVPAMLTPGEFVVRKAITDRVGVDNLARFNAGVMSFAELARAASSKKKMDGLDTGMGGSFDGTGGMNPPSFFAGGGLVPEAPRGPSGSAGVAGLGGSVPTTGTDNSMNFGDVNIYNPAPEPSSTSLPRTIRSLGYLGSSTRGNVGASS